MTKSHSDSDSDSDSGPHNNKRSKKCYVYMPASHNRKRKKEKLQVTTNSMGGVGEASSKLRRAAKKMVVAACSAFSRTHYSLPPPSPPPPMSKPPTEEATANAPVEEEEPQSPSNLASKNVCAICLDVLSYNSKGSSPRQAIFTAQCSHAFHLSCISSNVRHGSVSCPICRAHWTQLPRNISPSASSADPIFRILDDSIATLRVQRRSLSRAARYDDDDPIEPHHNLNRSPLRFSLIPIPQAVLPSSLDPTTRPAYLSIKLAHPPATDMVLVASPNGPHLRLLKQCMSLVVFSLQPTDRLAIVTYSSAASRVFPLRRMTSYGRRTALQLIDRLFYMGQADPIEGLNKGVKILQDRMHRNPHSCILHLSDSPTRSYTNMQVRFPIHRFHVGFGFGASNGFVVHEFEEFLRRLLGGAIREVQLRVGQEAKIIRIGELSGGEERRILLDLGDSGHVCVGYSYVDECIRTGESIVCVGEKRESGEEGGDVGRDIISSGIGGRSSCVESWDYHDPYMARRWAKHLHAYRL